MKKSFKPMLPFVIAAMCSIVACKKDTLKDSANNAQSTHQPMSKISTTASFNFDQFGISHNNYLTYVRNNPNFEGMSSQDRYEYGNTYSDELMGNKPPMPWDEFVSYHAHVKDIVNDMFNAEDPSEIVSIGGRVSPEMAQFWNNLSFIFRQASASAGTMTPSQFANKISTLETTVRKDNDIQIDLEKGESNDGAAMLEMCAIARYSYAYWYDNFGDWAAHEPVEAGTMFLRGLRRAAADVGGYMGGIEYCNGRNIWGGICWDNGYCLELASGASAKY